MLKQILYTLVFVGISAAAVAFSPKPVKAQVSPATVCACNGGCEDLQYYNYCGHGMCSWFCG